MTNEKVGNYGFNKARVFAKQTNAQLLWVQAEDYLDDPHFADLTKEDKKERTKTMVTFKIPLETNRLHTNTVALVL